jgi:hypothetical protein
LPLQVLRVLQRRSTRGLRAPLRENRRKIGECRALGGVQILLQGGHNPSFRSVVPGLMRYIKLRHRSHPVFPLRDRLLRGTSG